MRTILTTTRARALAVLLCAAIAGQGCATVQAGLAAPAPQPLSPDEMAVLADYVQRLPPGSAVRLERRSGPPLRGTLMKATADHIVLQPRTRLPEPPVQLPLAEVLAVTPDSGNGGHMGKAIAAGAAAGAAAALAIFFILVAILD
jgi:hypothetical protein